MGVPLAAQSFDDCGFVLTPFSRGTQLLELDRVGAGVTTTNGAESQRDATGSLAKPPTKQAV